VEHLKALPRLQSLSLTELDYVAMPLAELKGLEALETLSIGLPIPEELQLLKQLPQVRYLRLEQQAIPSLSQPLPALDAGLLAATECPWLERLSIKETRSHQQLLPLHVTQQLHRLPRLESLSLKGAVFTADSFKPITSLPRLKRLRLRNCHALTDDTLKQLATLKTLEWLRIDESSGYSLGLAQGGLQSHLPHARVDVRPPRS